MLLISQSSKISLFPNSDISEILLPNCLNMVDLTEDNYWGDQKEGRDMEEFGYLGMNHMIWPLRELENNAR